MSGKWVAWCPCCRDYETSERHQRQCQLKREREKVELMLTLVNFLSSGASMNAQAVMRKVRTAITEATGDVA